MTCTTKKLVDPIEAFEARCDARAYLWSVGDLDLHDAVDQLQRDAERDGLVERVGQNAMQAIIADAFQSYRETAS